MDKDLKDGLILLTAQTAATIIIAGTILLMKKWLDSKDDPDVGLGGFNKDSKSRKKKDKK